LEHIVSVLDVAAAYMAAAALKHMVSVAAVAFVALKPLVSALPLILEVKAEVEVEVNPLVAEG
jgi:hypothetical protein